MRWMGLDYGDKTIGVALSDEFGWTAQGLEVIRRTTVDRDLARIQEIIANDGVKEIVVGLPKHMNGQVGERGQQCIEFAQMLNERMSLPVHLWDERLSTVAAERTLISADVSRRKRKQVVDKIAAAIILQGYLDSIQTKRRDEHD